MGIRFVSDDKCSWEVWIDGYRDQQFGEKKDSILYCDQARTVFPDHLYSIYRVMEIDGTEVRSLVDQYYPIERLC